MHICTKKGIVHLAEKKWNKRVVHVLIQDPKALLRPRSIHQQNKIPLRDRCGLQFMTLCRLILVHENKVLGDERVATLR